MFRNTILKINKVFWLTALTVFLIFGLAITSLAALNHNKTITRLTVGGLKVGRLSRDQIKPFLADQTERFDNQKVSFVFGEKKWDLTPSDFGIKINENEIASNALSFGHGSGLTSLAEQIGAFFAGQDLPLDYSIDSSKLRRTTELFSAIETPVKNASINYNPQKNDFSVSPAQNGTTVNRARLIDDIIKSFSSPATNIYLTLAEAKPRITEEKLEQVIEEAKQLISNAPYWLQSADTTWNVNKTELAEWISVSSSNDDQQKAQLILDAGKIKDFLTPLAASINREPTDAQLTSENGELKFIALSQNGTRLNIEASAEKIVEDILSGEKNIYLITASVAPRISNQNTKELGLLTLLGKGESNFTGSPTNRQINIKVGATKLNGFLIKPGEEFSFSTNIGEIDAPNGWVQELVIKNKQTVPEFGGGLCQVSTTLFRAAVNSGLKITERHPHAYPVRYYDPPGFDATVYPPNPDLKFINDTPGHILLQSKIEDNKLIFEVYGTADGRQVKIKGPVITQKNPDGSLKANLTQEIWRDGQLERQQTFFSNYNSPGLYPTVTATPSPSPSPTN